MELLALIIILIIYVLMLSAHADRQHCIESKLRAQKQRCASKAVSHTREASTKCSGPLNLQTGEWCAPPEPACKGDIPAAYEALLKDDKSEVAAIIELQYTEDCSASDHMQYLFKNVRDELMSSAYGRSRAFSKRKVAGCGDSGQFPRLVKWSANPVQCSIYTSTATTYGSIRDWILA